MISLIILLPLVSALIGLYFITLGLWDLREGVNRNQYIKYMFTGLFLLIILTPMLWFFGSTLFVSM
ncbi:hypothetical protein E3U55_14580 [Filobacillus milosensis]|uniref:Uncharacterized protein n=1 Tax=Filobacillus milosensis TaxID=94137 RepID=A0A4Y8IDX2_9BACI|nr:hypothetical protein [Filobacillus milosensis]TFB14136.1 hypothetical protein E3U55_14580 [Filobacillus milosensis]